MTYSVAVAYNDFPGLELEHEVLDGIHVEFIRLDGLDSQEMQERAGRADALMVTTHPVRHELMQKLTRCKIISRVGTGLTSLTYPPRPSAAFG